MLELFRGSVGRRVLTVVATEASDGDMRPDGQVERQRALTGEAWVMVDEEHGIAVFDADRPLAGPPPEADVIVTTAAGTHTAIWAGDCAPVVLCGASGTLVVAHAGWKGLAAGVLDVAVGALTDRGDRVGAAVLGPCIHAECYEFGPFELDAVARGIAGAGEGADEPADGGVDVRAARSAIHARTSGGRPALDVPAAVAWGLRRHGVELDVVGPCTACDTRFFSHRARADAARHAVVAWTTEVVHRCQAPMHDLTDAAVAP